MKQRSKGKSKIDIKFIEDDKKRADTLYKRRRGIIKKVHELGVVCGLKISLIATDFNKMCFTYSNDERLSPMLSKIFKCVNKPIWLTDFSNLDYPFKSVKKENRKKLLYGRFVELGEEDVDFKFESYINNLDVKLINGDSGNGGFDFIGKRPEPEEEINRLQTTTTTDGNKSFQNPAKERNKILKIERIESKNQSFHSSTNSIFSQKKVHKIPSKVDESTKDQIPGSLKPLRSIKRRQSFINLGPTNVDKILLIQDLDEYLTFSMVSIMEEIKKNATFSRRLLRINPNFYGHLNRANNTLLKRMSKERYYFDILILRNMLCIYFSSHEFSPFKFIKKIPLEAVIRVLKKIDEINIQKVNEVFLRVVFDKINPSQRFSFEEECQKIRFCSKLYSIKRFHVKKVLISTYYTSSVSQSKIQDLINKGKINLQSSQTSSQDGGSIRHSEIKSENGLPFTEDFGLKYRTNLLLIEDGYFAMTCNEMIGLFNVNLMGGSFFSTLPEQDVKLFSMVLAERDLRKIPVVDEVLKMEKERNKAINEEKKVLEKAKKANSAKNLNLSAQEHQNMGSSVKLNSEIRETGRQSLDGFNLLGDQAKDVGGVSACSDFSFNLYDSGPLNFNFFNF